VTIFSARDHNEDWYSIILRLPLPMPPNNSAHAASLGR